MKIGVFDSGLGGLVVLKGIKKRLPKYDYLYLGDTKRVPYGDRSQTQIYGFVQEAVAYLFKQECELIILACNTASAEALRKIQQRYLPKHYPKRKVLGIIIPTVEEVAAKKYKRVGILATAGTVKSKAYEREFKKFAPNAKIYSYAAPRLVELIESGTIPDQVVADYTKPLYQLKPDCLVLGCTHYPIAEKQIAKFMPKQTELISQEQIIPAKLKTYLHNHPEIEKNLTKHSQLEIRLTAVTDESKRLVQQWFGNIIKPHLVKM